MPSGKTSLVFRLIMNEIPQVLHCLVDLIVKMLPDSSRKCLLEIPFISILLAHSPPPLPAKLTPLPPWWPRWLWPHPTASQRGEFSPRLTPPWGHGAVSGDILGVTPEGGDRLPAPRGQRPGRLLGVLQRTGQHPHQPRAVCLKPCQSGETLKIELDFCAPNPFLLCVKGTVSHNLPRRQT